MRQEKNRYKIIPSGLDYVNKNAKVVVVGKTPGSNQMNAAIEGLAPIDVKKKRAFAGSIRSNLVKMLDYIGVNKYLDINSCISLWANDYEQNADFTSILKNCVIDTQNEDHPFISSIPSMEQYAEIKKEFEEGFVYDCKDYSCVRLWVALGPDVEGILKDLQKQEIIKPNAVIIALPHPSGANNGRVSAFLGTNKKEGTAENKARAMREKALIQMRQLINT